MTISNDLIIAGRATPGRNGLVHGHDAATGERLEPGFGGATLADLEQACAQAWAAFDAYRETDLEARAAFLETIGQEIMAIGDVLIERGMCETGLPRGRLEGERARTVGQLGLFAQVLRDGGFQDVRIAPGQKDRQPAPRPDLRLRNIALGPVAVFGASNFPLAFSVAGGDTASALAAGCPVIVKAHSAHPGVSQLVARAVAAAVEACGMPAGVFSMLYDSGREIGQGLVADPRIAAVGFTGSRGGGQALMAIAAARPAPIPVYAEMSSINPVVLMPHALKARGAAIGAAFVGSLTLGAGQFCTNPGLLLAVEGPGLDDFIAAVREAMAAAPAQIMLTEGIRKAYDDATRTIAQRPGVEVLASGQAGGDLGQALALQCSGDQFLKDEALRDEMFGAASLLVRCRDLGQVAEILESLEGQLTAAVHLDDADHEAVRALTPILERKAGRILANGFGTGVEVSPAMVHGGPYPATSDGRSTSVGSLAINRFLRPVCYQDMPAALLPAALRD